MNRRELIKSGLIAAGTTAIGVVAARNKALNDCIFSPIDIIPKQTDIYKIYAPMPFNFEFIDEMIEMNSKFKKSQIKTFYNNFPYPLCSQFDFNFETVRGRNYDIKSFDDFAKRVKYVQDKGFKFVYLLNSPKPFTAQEFSHYKKELFMLLDNLASIGCLELKIANTQLMQIVSRERPEFVLSASTSFEYHNISQYVNLINAYPQIKSINVAIDDNHNFLYLQNIKKTFPNVDIEVMVNERCIHGCPARISHCSSFFESFHCKELMERIGKFKYFFSTNLIYPWQLEYYSAIGINTFKFMSYPLRADINNIKFLRNYLKCIEYGIKDLTADDFFNGIFEMDIKIKNNVLISDIIHLFPDFKHFVKYGGNRSNVCGIDCHYCMDCSNKIKEVIEA